MKKRNAALMIVIALVALSTIISLSLSSGATPIATLNGNDAASPISSPLNETDAEDLALTAVGLSRDDVIWERTEYDRERGQDVWEVEFYHDGVEYDFEINADTGEILKQKQENERKPDGKPESKPDTKPSTDDAPAGAPEAVGLTRDETIALALADAKLSADDVTCLKAKQDYDDGVWVYEIEFDQGQTEYDYEIRISDGKIIERDVEWDD